MYWSENECYTPQTTCLSSCSPLSRQLAVLRLPPIQTPQKLCSYFYGNDDDDDYDDEDEDEDDDDDDDDDDDQD